MPTPTPTDKILLRSLLDAGRDKLTSHEVECFTRMLTDLENGIIVTLSKAQKLWAEQKYNHLDLGRHYKDKPVPKVKVRIERKTETVWEKPKALRPPNKR